MLRFASFMLLFAPIIHAQHVFSGCQIGAPDSVYNTRIDSLPVHANSAAWIAQSMAIGAAPITFESSFGVNILANSAQVSFPTFFYTPGLNGKPFVFAANPRKRENGELTTDGNSDHHMISLDPATCRVYESYQDGGGANGASAQSGYTYISTDDQQPTGGTTDAAGLPLLPLIVHRSEIESGLIAHALRFTSCAGCISKTFLWPATYSTGGEPTAAPMGTRWRLKSSVDISHYSREAQVVLTALKQYGKVLADIGQINQIEISSDVHENPKISAALDEITASPIRQDSYEIVDQSSLMSDVSSSKANAAAAALSPAVSSVGSTVNSIGDIIRIDVGSSVPYTDTLGNVWMADPGAESGYFSRQFDNAPSAWKDPDWRLYASYDYTYGDDMVRRFKVSKGDYDVTFWLARGSCDGKYNSGNAPAGPIGLDVNGSITTFDVEAAEQHICRVPVSKTIRVSGVDSLLVAVRSMTVGQTHSIPQLNALSIIPVPKVVFPMPIPTPVPILQGTTGPTAEAYTNSPNGYSNVWASKMTWCNQSLPVPPGATNIFCNQVWQTIGGEGQNYNVPNLGTSITNWQAAQVTQLNSAAGQAIGLGVGVDHPGVGDTSAMSISAYHRGGCIASTDQCGQGIDIHVVQGRNDFVGEVLGTVSGISGNQLTVEVTQGNVSSDKKPGLFHPDAGAGRYVLNTKNPLGDGCAVTGIDSHEFGASPAVYTAKCSTPLTATQYTGRLGSDVKAGATTASPIDSGLICISDGFSPTEFVMASGGQMAVSRPHTASAIVTSGAGCGQFIALTADDMTNDKFQGSLTYPIRGVMRRFWPVLSVEAPDPSDGTQRITVAVQGKGAWRQVVSQWRPDGDNGFTMLPGAEIYSVATPEGEIGYTWRLSHDAGFAVGDPIEVPHHPAVGSSFGQMLAEQVFPDFTGATGHFGIRFEGPMIGGALFELTNGTPQSFYQGLGGNYLPPMGVKVSGPVLYSFFSNFGGYYADLNVGCSAVCKDQWHWLLRKSWGADGQGADGLMVDETSGKMTITSHNQSAQIVLDGANQSVSFTGVGLAPGCLQIDQLGKVTSSGKPCIAPASLLAQRVQRMGAKKAVH